MLTNLSAAQIAEVTDDLRAFVDLRGLQLLGSPFDGWGPAFASGTVQDRSEAFAAVDAVDASLQTGLPTVQSAGRAEAEAAGFRRPETLAETGKILDLLAETDELLGKISLDAFQLDLPQLAQDLAPARSGFIGRTLRRLISGRFRAALKQSSNLCQIAAASAADRLAVIEGAREVSASWSELGADSVTKPPTRTDLGAATQNLRTQLETLQGLGLLPNADTVTFTELLHDLERLREHAADARNMPELRPLHASLVGAGLAEFLAAAAAHNLGVEERSRRL